MNPNRTVTFRAQPGAKIRLVCFPHAGGAASAFNAWADSLPDHIEVVAVQYPGRETRWLEKPISDPESLVEDCQAGLQPLLDGTPIAFFGHSLGAFLAFEIAVRLDSIGAGAPASLIVSARRAPGIPSPVPGAHRLPEDEFLRTISRLDGTPAEVMEHSELMAFYLPVLRADFTADELYSPPPGRKYSGEIHIFGGAADPLVPRDQLAAWLDRSSSGGSLNLYPGGHFYFRAPGSGFFDALTDLLARAAE